MRVAVMYPRSTGAAPEVAPENNDGLPEEAVVDYG
jgi:hypothetical protein